MGNQQTIRASEEHVKRAAADYGRNLARVGDGDELFHIFQDLGGEDVFMAGHRFHLLGTVARIEIDPFGEPIIFLDNAHQIDYDESDNIPNSYFVGNGLRIPASAVGLCVQKIAGRPQGYQDAWAKIKAGQSTSSD